MNGNKQLLSMALTAADIAERSGVALDSSAIALMAA